jgi:hypothetical protein
MTEGPQASRKTESKSVLAEALGLSPFWGVAKLTLKHAVHGLKQDNAEGSRAAWRHDKADRQITFFELKLVVYGEPLLIEGSQSEGVVELDPVLNQIEGSLGAPLLFGIGLYDVLNSIHRKI